MGGRGALLMTLIPVAGAGVVVFAGSPSVAVFGQGAVIFGPIIAFFSALRAMIEGRDAKFAWAALFIAALEVLAVAVLIYVAYVHAAAYMEAMTRVRRSCCR